MRGLAWLALLVALAAPALAQENAEGGIPADPYAVCTQDVKNLPTLIKQGFFWVGDPQATARLTGRLAADLVCEAKARRSRNPCAELVRMGPAYTYKKEIGTLQAECNWLESYADFWWEEMSAKPRQRSFPACEDHLNRLVQPVKFFDLKAHEPRSVNHDPDNDGGFWNVCQVIGDRMRAGRSDICEPRVKYYLGPAVPPDMWKTYCDAVAKLWVDGDDAFCDLQKPDNGYCLEAAQMTRAFRQRSGALCPASGVGRGICLEKLAPKAQQPCAQTWQELQGDFCTTRASRPAGSLPKPKGKRRAGGDAGDGD